MSCSSIEAVSYGGWGSEENQAVLGVQGFTVTACFVTLTAE